MSSPIDPLFDLQADYFDYELIMDKLQQIPDLSKDSLVIGRYGPLSPHFNRDKLIKNDDSELGYGEFLSANAYFQQAKVVNCERLDLVPMTRRSTSPYNDAYVPKEEYYEHLPVWENKKIHTAFMANWLKFTQNQDLARKLLATGNKYLVMKTPRPWGVLSPTSDDRFNVTGKILMIIREELLRDKTRRASGYPAYMSPHVN